jgi:methyltransferase (TIGR00027 family)
MTNKVSGEDKLGQTSHWTAAVRALESKRQDRLFNDPWADQLAGPEGTGWVEQRSEDKVLPIVLRTRFYDDFLLKITRQEQIQQVVLLAAGLDTRAFRLRWPVRTRLFELDQPAVLNHKEGVLAAAGAVPTCARQIICIDLTAPWEGALLAAGYETTKPSLWLLEGFLFYLPNHVHIELLERVTNLTSRNSWMGFAICNSLVLTFPFTKPRVDMQAALGAPWLGTMEDPQTLLAERGWKATLTQAGAENANHGRWHLPVYPSNMPNMPHHWLVTAQCSRN